MTRNITTAMLCSIMLAVSLNIYAEPIDQENYLAASEFQLERKEHVWTDGSRYEGEWMKSQPHGYGSITYANGSQYWGRFEHGRRHGQGMMKYENSDEFEGNWHKDQPQGKGTKRYAAGSVYEGDFKEGKQQGEGKQTYIDGTYYEGHWNEGKPHGYGKLTFISGGIYEGAFLNGRPEGKGRYHYPNGDVYFGQWRNGNQDGKGRVDFNTGGYYEGEYVEGMKHGSGVLVSALGHTYTGPFKYNEAHGEGTCSMADNNGPCQYKRNKRVSYSPMIAKADTKTSTASKTTLTAVAVVGATALAKANIAPPKATPKTQKKKAQASTKTPSKPKPAPIEFVAKPFTPESAKPTSKPSKYAIAKTAIPTATLIKATEAPSQSKEQFTQTLNTEKEKVKAMTIADLRQDQSDIYFKENWEKRDLMAIPETAYWQKKASMFSNAMQIVSVHGDTEIRLQINDYEGPGNYEISKARIASNSDDLDADNIQSGTINIESDENGWVTGSFNLKVDDGNGNALAFNDGLFRLSSKDALPILYR